MAIRYLIAFFSGKYEAKFEIGYDNTKRMTLRDIAENLGCKILYYGHFEDSAKVLKILQMVQNANETGVLNSSEIEKIVSEN